MKRFRCSKWEPPHKITYYVPVSIADLLFLFLSLSFVHISSIHTFPLSSMASALPVLSLTNLAYASLKNLSCGRKNVQDQDSSNLNRNHFGKTILSSPSHHFIILTHFSIFSSSVLPSISKMLDAPKKSCQWPKQTLNSRSLGNVSLKV
jgi:hypothetical protein